MENPTILGFDDDRVVHPCMGSGEISVGPGQARRQAYFVQLDRSILLCGATRCNLVTFRGELRSGGNNRQMMVDKSSALDGKLQLVTKGEGKAVGCIRTYRAGPRSARVCPISVVGFLPSPKSSPVPARLCAMYMPIVDQQSQDPADNLDSV
jgi:hypothetical protein